MGCPLCLWLFPGVSSSAASLTLPFIALHDKKLTFLADGVSGAGCAVWEAVPCAQGLQGLIEVRCSGRAELWAVSWETRSRNPQELN